ncbi:MAG: class E sortase [Micropruina sp.]|nr:MAG: class E sortase [Micropruina sp.]
MTTTEGRRAVPGAPRRARRTRRPVLRWLGGLLVLIGLACVGWYTYQAYFEPVIDEQGARAQVSEVKKRWAQGMPETAPVPDQAMGLLRVPGFGPDYEVAVVDGISEYALSVGVGWFPGTAGPGQIGNFALAGHRGRSGPFVQLPELEQGALIQVETRDAIYTYRLTNNPSDLTVDKSETWVIDPVPGHPDAKPTKALITLITCANFFHSPERSVAFGELVETVAK